MSKTQFFMGKSPFPPEKGETCPNKGLIFFFLELNLTFPAQFPPLIQQPKFPWTRDYFLTGLSPAPWFIPPRNVLQKNPPINVECLSWPGFFKSCAVVSLFFQAGIFSLPSSWKTLQRNKKIPKESLFEPLEFWRFYLQPRPLPVDLQRSVSFYGKIME